MTKKPIIAVDIDDTLGPTTEGWVAFSNERWGHNLTVEDYDEDWGKMWGVDHEETLRRIPDMYTSGVVESLTHDPEAVRVLSALATRYDLVVTTSRHSNFAEATRIWIEQYYKGIFKDIHLAGIYDNFSADAVRRTKGDLITAIGADFLIDDQPKHCLAVAAQGKTGILFGDYAWNRQFEPTAGVVRCVDWQAVEAYFDGQS